MASTVILSDNGASSGSAGIKTTGGNDGVLILQTTTSGGTATNAVYIDTSQNVGVGTSSPTQPLTVGNTSTVRGQVYVQSPAGASPTLTLDYTAQSGGHKYVLYSGGSAAGTFDIYDATAAAYRATIDSSGNLLVNTTSLTGGEKMALWYSSNTGPGLSIRDTTAQNGNTFIQFRNGSTTAGAITSNGTTTMTYGSASDYRLKKNLVPLTGALDKIASLQPKVGNWKADDSDFIGFVAHELQEIFPDAVVGEKDKTDAEGNPEYQMVDTGSASIIATLTAAIQEQQALITSLTARIAALEGAQQ